MSKQAVHDIVMERTASVAAYGTSVGVAYSGWTMQEWFGLIGVVLAILTFLVNLFYKHKTYRHQVLMMKRKTIKDQSKSDEDLES